MFVDFSNHLPKYILKTRCCITRFRLECSGVLQE